MFEFIKQFLRIVQKIVVHRQNPDLFGSQPGWKGPPKVLDEDSAEAFHGTEGSPVDHDRAVILIVGTNIGKIKPFWQIIIDLNCPKLPFSANYVFYNEIDFRSIKRCLTKLFLIFNI